MNEPHGDIPTERILVVDDDEHVQELCMAVLTRAGYAVVRATSGEAALAALARERVDLVLMDVGLGAMDGFATVERMRADGRLAAIPVVFITIQSDGESRQRALALGAADFIAKPLGRTELLIRVRPLLMARRLQREVGELYDLVRTQRDTLLGAREKRRDLMSFILHDLMHPLSAISLHHAELEGLALAAEAKPALDVIAMAADQMQRMLQNLRTVSESDEVGLELSRTEIDLSALIARLAREAALRVARAGRRLEVEVTPRTLISGDDLQLTRVVENLLDNAIKYCPDGSTVRLTVETRNGERVVRVSDQGPGIPPSERRAIFDRYYRLRRDRIAHARDGHGLGLALCKLVVEAHDGRIWVEDADGGGASFCFAIPSLAAPEPV